MNRWQRKVRALIRLAEDQASKPEGAVARQKLHQILEKYPEARQYEPVRKFMVGDLKRMRQAGISTDGRWTGRDLAEALALMAADYAQRLAGRESRIEQERLTG